LAKDQLHASENMSTIFLILVYVTYDLESLTIQEIMIKGSKTIN